MAGQKQEEIYQNLFRVWNYEYTATDVQGIANKDCFLQDIRTLGRDLQEQLSNEKTPIGQTVINKTLANLRFMLNDLLEIRTQKIMEAARELRILDEGILFEMEINYYRSLLTAFKGYSKTKKMLVNGENLEKSSLASDNSPGISDNSPDTPNEMETQSIKANSLSEDQRSPRDSLISKNPEKSTFNTTPTPKQLSPSPGSEINLAENEGKFSLSTRPKISPSPSLISPDSVASSSATISLERLKSAPPLIFDGKYTLIRILKPLPPLVGEDFEIYGPFQAEDVINLPKRNADILIEEKLAKRMVDPT